MEIKIRSDRKVSFVPQHGSQYGVTTTGMASVAPTPQNPNAPEVINTVRFEWNQDGEEFGAEIVRALAGHHRQHEKQHEPAA